jgi:hypothetical protein
MNRLVTAFTIAFAVAFPALAQGIVPGATPSNRGGGAEVQQNNTGGAKDVVVPRGPTGADTYNSDSAAAGNAQQPSRSVPNGSSGGNGGGGH